MDPESGWEVFLFKTILFTKSKWNLGAIASLDKLQPFMRTLSKCGSAGIQRLNFYSRADHLAYKLCDPELFTSLSFSIITGKTYMIIVPMTPM